jgi:hypothetical protein
MSTAKLDQIVRQKDPRVEGSRRALSTRRGPCGNRYAQKAGRITEVADPAERIRVIARDYADNPASALVVSPDNASRRQLNDAIRLELQSKGIPMNKSMLAPEAQRVHSRTPWLGDAGGFPCERGGAALLAQRCSRRRALPCAADETECEPACGPRR